jgi:GT2 family glycosyltransferase/capsular polysaccharide biosynthesis protein
LLLTAETAPGRETPRPIPAATLPWEGRHADGEAERAQLQFLAVESLPRGGTVVLGFLSDPGQRVDRVTLGGHGSEPIDLLKSSATLAGPDARRVFGLPPSVDVTYAFVAHIPHEAAEDAPTALVLLRSGAAHCQKLSQTGDLGLLLDVIDRAPPAYGLAVMALLLRGHRGGGAPAALPPVLERAVQRVYQGIDPAREYGVGTGQPAALCHVDTVTRVGDQGILLKGWLLIGPNDRLHSITLVSLSGHRAIVPTPMPRLARPDVIGERAFEIYTQDRNCGFVVFAPVDHLSPQDRHWCVEVRLASGAIRRTPFLCGPAPTPMQGIRSIVSLAEASACDFNDLFKRAIAPSLDWFWSQLQQDRPQTVVEDYGPQPEAPLVSIIVPLYGRMDLVRHQIVSFSRDAEFRPGADLVELIFVLDDPSAEQMLRPMCRLLRDIYRVPFRLVLQKRNLGYSAANNAGARLAKGRTLILLNSDVIPRHARWVSQMLSLYEALPQCGILGCRLLFEDGSIQHAGMNFRPSLFLDNAWSNEHSFKGLSTAFDPHDRTEAVAAVTGACLMIDRALYTEIGGLDEGYVIGDFEDSDLCLKVHDRGLKVYYTPEIELYHLERQSMRRIGHGGDDWRQSLTLLNMWKHSQRWGALIPQICALYDPGFVPAEPAIATKAAEPGLMVPAAIVPTIAIDPPAVAEPAAAADRLPPLRCFAEIGTGEALPILPAVTVQARSGFVTFPRASDGLSPCEAPDFAMTLPAFSAFAFETVHLHGFRLFETQGKLFNDQSLTDPTDEASAHFWRKFHEQQEEDVRLGDDGFPIDEPFEEIDATGCLILSSDEPANFGSWIYRFLAKYLLASADQSFDRVFAYDDGRWMRPVLALVNPKVEILPQDPARAYRLRNALIPSLPAPHVFLRPELIEAFAGIADRIGIPAGLPERVYVSRRKQALLRPGLRVMENEAALVEKLAAQSFVEFFPEDHALEMQIAVFANARIIVSPGGSNLFCAAFARKAEFILDIESAPHWLYAHMNLLASTHRPFSVVQGLRTGRGDPIHTNWTVDVDAIIDGLKALGVINAAPAIRQGW